MLGVALAILRDVAGAQILFEGRARVSLNPPMFTVDPGLEMAEALVRAMGENFDGQLVQVFVTLVEPAGERDSPGPRTLNP